MRILVSSCLLGENVRFDGNNSSITFNKKFTFIYKELFMDILAQNEIYSFCPELAGGLKIPRQAAEIKKSVKPFLVKTKEGTDVTINFLLGAKACLDFCKQENIKVALMKSKSPSCGNLEIYDGSFTNTLIKNQGLSAKLLIQNNIKVFNEEQLKDLYKFISLDV